MELIGAKERGERLDYGGPAAAVALPGRPDRPEAHVLVGRVAGLELPPRDRGVTGIGDPRDGEQLERVPPDCGEDGERVLPEHAVREIARDGRGPVPGRPEAAQRRLRTVHERVVAELERVLASRAQPLLVGRKFQRMAVGGQYDPAVQLVGALVGQPEMPGDRQRRRAVSQDGQQESGGEHCPEPQLDPPPTDRDEQIDRGGQDEDLADLPDGGGGAQRQAAGDARPGPGPALPEQDDQPRHDERLEQDIGHNALLHLELIAIEQDGRCGQSREHAGSAAPQQHHVQGHGHSQAKQVLHRGDHVQVAYEKDRLQQGTIAQRVVAAGQVQVPDRVAEEQGGTVGGLREDAQRQARRQQHRQQPVPPTQRAEVSSDPADATASSDPAGAS